MGLAGRSAGFLNGLNQHDRWIGLSQATPALVY